MRFKLVHLCKQRMWRSHRAKEEIVVELVSHRVVVLSYEKEKPSENAHQCGKYNSDDRLL